MIIETVTTRHTRSGAKYHVTSIEFKSYELPAQSQSEPVVYVDGYTMGLTDASPITFTVEHIGGEVRIYKAFISNAGLVGSFREDRFKMIALLWDSLEKAIEGKSYANA